MRPTRLVAPFLGCLVTLFVAASAATPQPPTARDTAALERRLAVAKGSARIPLLLALADARREQSAAVLALTQEALTLLEANPSPSLEVRAHVLRSFALETTGDYDRAFGEAQRAERAARMALADTATAEAAYQLGFVEWRRANYAAATVAAERARTLLEPRGNSALLARTRSLVGAIHYMQGDYDAALRGYLGALQVSEAMGDEIAVARWHNNIGLVYVDLGRKQEALAALKRALSIHERLGPKSNLTNTLNNVGLTLLELDRPREALPYLERAMANDRAANNPYGLAKELSNIGHAYEKLKEPDRAVAFHQQALAVRERIGDKDGLVRTRGALAEIELKRGDARTAITLFEQSIALALEINDRHDAAIQLEWLSTAHLAVGDTGRAFLAYRRYHELQATLSDSATRGRIAELETRYQARERERDLATMSALAESRRDKLRWLIAGSALLGLALVLLGVLYVLRGRAQRALAESEQRYRALFHAVGVPIFLLDADTRHIVDLNGPAQALCGADAVTRGATVGELKPAWLGHALSRLFGGEQSDQPAIDDCWTDAPGGPRWTELRGSAVTLGGRSCLLVTVRDATEEHRQQELRQREDKVQALGVLAGGIAHDFNNALTAIVGHVTLAKNGNPAEQQEMLAYAEKAAIGASRLTKQLLAFSKGGAPVRRITNVGRLLRDTVGLAGAGSHMRVDVDVPGDLWHAHVDSGQFSQVVSNIVINAQQATGEGGRLLVRASNFHGALPTGAATGDARFVRIDFIDNGTGIAESIRHRVFDPYFSTRSGGSGLGLATAFAICRNHGGTLTFESRVGSGTIFSAFFPASSEVEVEPTSAPSHVPSGSGSILVLDDEPSVQLVLRRTLERWGYQVETVADGRHAVQRYLERMQAGRPFDLLIMDLTIPGGMGGRQAMAEILQHDPQARAIVASGYSDDPTMANYREAGFMAAMAKPFQHAELGRLVSTVMARSTAEARGGPAPKPVTDAR